MLGQPGNGAVKQVKIEMPFVGLPQMSGKLTHPNGVCARSGQAFGIAVPIAFIDMFGVMRAPRRNSSWLRVRHTESGAEGLLPC